jgi:anti-sigma factor RsiW
MDNESQLKLQAFCDGELPEAESREVAAWLARDTEATDLLKELRNTRKALKGFEPELKLPETREFYWSKIQREIERLEPVPKTKETIPIFSWLRRLAIPAGIMAAVFLASFFVFLQTRGGGNAGIEMATVLADANPVTYRDQAEGMTVVWLSYPAEKKFTPNNSGDTLQ